MTSNVLGVNQDLLTVLTTGWGTTAAVTLMMLVLGVLQVLDSLPVHHSNLFHYQCYYYVACNTTGDIRLRDGADSFEGRIEICYNQAWDTVCHDFWSTTNANVACGQLGFRNIGKFVIICVSSK